jgi:hypothetical protein
MLHASYNGYRRRVQPKTGAYIIRQPAANVAMFCAHQVYGDSMKVLSQPLPRNTYRTNQGPAHVNGAESVAMTTDKS